ncbi:hypothetical protein GCM10008949_02290 [Deinococcus humi]|nr:hypothetical protein GCM10008949_02290 [Deinococcus humi]
MTEHILLAYTGGGLSPTGNWAAQTSRVLGHKGLKDLSSRLTPCRDSLGHPTHPFVRAIPPTARP